MWLFLLYESCSTLFFVICSYSLSFICVFCVLFVCVDIYSHVPCPSHALSIIHKLSSHVLQVWNGPLMHGAFLHVWWLQLPTKYTFINSGLYTTQTRLKNTRSDVSSLVLLIGICVPMGMWDQVEPCVRLTYRTMFTHGHMGLCSPCVLMWTVYIHTSVILSKTRTIGPMAYIKIQLNSLSFGYSYCSYIHFDIHDINV